MGERNGVVVTESAQEGAGRVTLTIELPGGAGEYAVRVSRAGDEGAWEEGPGLAEEPPRFFISYSSRDEVLAKRLSKLLRETFCVDCFCSAEALGAGEAWPSVLEKNLRTCDVLVYLSSAHSNESIWCQQEAAWALGRGIPVFPLLLDDAPMRGALERLERLPETDADKWVPRGEQPSSRDWLDANRYVAKTVVAPILSSLARRWGMREGVAELLVRALEKADRPGKGLCVKDVLVSTLDEVSEGHVARIDAACDRSAWVIDPDAEDYATTDLRKYLASMRP